MRLGATTFRVYQLQHAVIRILSDYIVVDRK